MLKIKTLKDFINESLSEEDLELIKNTLEVEPKYKDGLYIKLSLDEVSDKLLREWHKETFGKEIEHDLHCTIVYSKKERIEEITPKEYSITATFDKFSFFGDDNNILVMELKSEELQKLHKDYMEIYSLDYDYPEYNPHITLDYNSTETLSTVSQISFDSALNLEKETIVALEPKENKEKVVKETKPKEENEEKINTKKEGK